MPNDPPDTGNVVSIHGPGGFGNIGPGDGPPISGGGGGDGLDQRLDRLESKMDGVEDRLRLTEIKMAEVGERVASLSSQTDDRFTSLSAQMDSKFDAISSRIDKMPDNWGVAKIVGAFAGIMIAVMLLQEKIQALLGVAG